MSRRARAGLLGAVLVLGVLAGCTVEPAASRPAAAGSSSGTIAFLLPESKTSRYESIDRPVFETVVAERCPECRVLYANAGQDAARQQQQAESALT